jgi:hypothetical protein
MAKKIDHSSFKYKYVTLDSCIVTHAMLSGQQEAVAALMETPEDDFTGPWCAKG